MKNTGCLIAPAVLSQWVCCECCLKRGEHDACVTVRSPQLADCQGNTVHGLSMSLNMYSNCVADSGIACALACRFQFCASLQEAKCAAAWHEDWKGNLYEFYLVGDLITLPCLSCWKNSDRLFYGEAGRSFFCIW